MTGGCVGKTRTEDCSCGMTCFGAKAARCVEDDTRSSRYPDYGCSIDGFESRSCVFFELSLPASIVLGTGLDSRLVPSVSHPVCICEATSDTKEGDGKLSN